MTCHDIQKELLKRADQALALPEEIEAHLEGCAECRRFREVYELTMSMDRLEPSSELDRRVLQAARTVAPRPQTKRLLLLTFPQWRWVGLAATLILGLMLSALVWRQVLAPEENGVELRLVSYENYLQELEDGMTEDMFLLEAGLAFLNNGNSNGWEKLEADLLEFEIEYFLEFEI